MDDDTTAPEPNDPLVERLDALGSTPVDPGVADGHLAAMRAGAGEGNADAEVLAPRRWRRVAVGAAAAMVLVVAAGTGLAYAGALPDPVQDGAHEVLSKVGLNVPRSIEGCPEGKTYRNHGEYVSEVKAAGGDVEAASQSACGKPAHAGTGGPPEGTPGQGSGNGNGKGQGNGGGKGKGQAKHADDPYKGRPPWAGDSSLSDEEKDRLEAERDAACPDDDEADEADDDADEAEEREADEGTEQPPADGGGQPPADDGGQPPADEGAPAEQPAPTEPAPATPPAPADQG